jgi:putative ABC transport system permease protein
MNAAMAQGAFGARVALDAVRRNPLRAGLTSLGILFGVASVIAMLAVGRGAKQEILDQMQLLGANTVTVTPRRPTGVPRFSPGLTVRDARSLVATVPQIEAASGEIVVAATIARRGAAAAGRVVGVDAGYLDLLNLTLESGAEFTAGQLAAGAPVAIIGHGVRAHFFTTENPIGQTIKVGPVWLTVVGVIRDRPVAAAVTQKLGVRDPSMEIYVPTTTMLLRIRNRADVTASTMRTESPMETVVANLGRKGDADADPEQGNFNQLDRVIVRAEASEFVRGIAEVARRQLLRRHNQVADFEVTVPELLLRQEQRTRTIFNVVLGAIASISLLVGGIGIMNIMLANVLERLREIGVRRAVGARRLDILSQFLGEAVLISLAGGVAGIVLGISLSIAIHRLAGIRTSVSAWSLALACGVSVGVGVAFGSVPAWRAAHQDPVRCLRHE